MREKLSKILREVRDSGWLLGKFCVEQYPPDNAYLDQILTLLREQGYVELPENMSGAELIDWYAEHNYGRRQKGT